MRNNAVGKGSAPASGAVSRALAAHTSARNYLPFGNVHAASVRREAHRTTPGAGVLPKANSGAVVAKCLADLAIVPSLPHLELRCAGDSGTLADIAWRANHKSLVARLP
jgi:hypothetical protein